MIDLGDCCESHHSNPAAILMIVINRLPLKATSSQKAVVGGPFRTHFKFICSLAGFSLVSSIHFARRNCKMMKHKHCLLLGIVM